MEELLEICLTLGLKVLVEVQFHLLEDPGLILQELFQVDKVMEQVIDPFPTSLQIGGSGAFYILH